MDPERAKKVARAHTNASQGKGWFQWVREACRSLFPETDNWAVHEEVERGLPLVFAAGDHALFRLEVHPEGDPGPVAEVNVRRLALKEARVRIVETFASSSLGGTVKRRTWSFTFPSEDQVIFETEEDDEGPDRLERVARAAAREAGWRIAD